MGRVPLGVGFLVLMDAASVVYQKDGEVAVWQEGGAMRQAMADDGAAKGFYLFGGDDAPEFACQGDACYLFDDLGVTA